MFGKTVASVVTYLLDKKRRAQQGRSLKTSVFSVGRKYISSVFNNIIQHFMTIWSAVTPGAFIYVV